MAVADPPICNVLPVGQPIVAGLEQHETASMEIGPLHAQSMNRPGF